MTEADLLNYATQFTFTRSGPRRNANLREMHVTVEWRGDNSWAIVHDGFVYMRDGEFEYEPSPSNRTEEFLKAARWTLDEAIAQVEMLLNDKLAELFGY